MAEIQIFGFKNCNETRRTERFFKERGIKFHLVNMDEKPMSPGELRSVAAAVPVEDLLDREGKEYRRMQLQYMQFDIAGKLLENPRLMKTPVVRFGKQATVGFCPEIWKTWA